jgi:nanoRNase/pAp phosphatase (c-di-AMP/oligoRNAs hydrolase)
MEEIASLLKQIACEGKKILVLCHENADVDAVASVTVTCEALTSLGAKAIAGCESLSKLAEHVLSLMGRQIQTDPPFDADYFLLLDTSSLEHLGTKFSEKLKNTKVLMVDHHRPVEGTKKYLLAAYIDETSTSEAELVLRLLKELEFVPSPQQSTLLLAGILTDTAELRLAKPKTFDAIRELLQLGADYTKAQELIKLPDEPSRRIAMLKAAKRAEIEEIKDFIVVFSEVGAFEADAAVALLKLGADLAFVGSQDDERIRVSARARPEVCERTRLHLGELMMEAAKTFNGSGGGHAGAASFTGKASLVEVKGWLINKLYGHLVPKG